MIATAQATADVKESAKTSKPKRKRRAWQPSAQDHYVYHLVKFECLTQSEVAERQRLSQSTVSRIIQRYERWQAHADPREGGRLDPAERLRAQRWLTYERNELILTSALRLARETQGLQTVWSIANTRAASPYRAHHDQQREETRAIDRTGLAARYLRLAFKVNMEQLALVEKDPPPLPEPLTAAEIAEEERLDAAADADLAEQRRQEEENMAEHQAALAGSTPAPGEAPVDDPPAALREQVCSRLKEVEPLNLHKMHNANGKKSSATATSPCICATERELEKIAEDACIATASLAGRSANVLAAPMASDPPGRLPEGELCTMDIT